MIDPYVLPCTLGWANPNTGPENVRLYALDQGSSPRWAKPHARVAETAIVEHDAGMLREGDRYLIVRVGDRFVDDDLLAYVADRIPDLIAEAQAAPAGQPSPTDEEVLAHVRDGQHSPAVDALLDRLTEEAP